ncbi:MAG TPA: glycosyltransferase [Candidatus Aminicenantes bacterium]|nr:glycosyltransferase [Candidatus Aminicenantes bacterium]
MGKENAVQTWSGQVTGKMLNSKMVRWGRKVRNLFYTLKIRTWEPLERSGYKLWMNIRHLPRSPKISVVMPVFNIEPELLEKAVKSVERQVYPHWELCMADDGSTDPRVRATLERLRENEPRIRVMYLEQNQGISGASNAALSLASGEYLAFLDHDDELHPLALYKAARVINKHPQTDLIFSDEDKLTMDGQRRDVVRKPGWSPDLFLTYNYLCHLVVCRKALVDQVEGFRKGFEGSQDYDLLLRITERTDRIRYIPRVLYHWRMIPGSAAQVVDAKGYAFARSKQALREAMARRGIEAEVVDGESPGTFKVIAKPS